MTPTLKPQASHHYHFVTGRLAEAALRDVVERLSTKHQFRFSIDVMPITVAALITPRWLLRHLQVPEQATHVIVPGYCQANGQELEKNVAIPVVFGPNDCRDLPELFGDEKANADLSQYDTQIIAEINHAPRSTVREVVQRAKSYRSDGADIIDFGCDPTERCHRIADYIDALTDEGLTVSVDSFDPREVQEATRAGASLVLSVNSTNREAACDWGVEVVTIPDVPGDKKSFEKTVEFLDSKGVAQRLDPILEPIGSGFGESLLRYAQARALYPDHRMMMGIGNLTELTDVDSAGINLMLMSLCQEWNIDSVLTTEVINWASSSVRECDVARRLAHYSLRQGRPPKNVSSELVMLRDTKVRNYPKRLLSELAASLKDNNYRIFAQHDAIHLVSAGLHLQQRDPFLLFDELLQQPISANVDASHAFYLGYEMAKASLALTLDKQYNQDQALDWGMLTEPEDLHRIARTAKKRRGNPAKPRGDSAKPRGDQAGDADCQ